LGLKRPELAKRARLSYPYTSEIENGTKRPSTKALAQLAEALELTSAELMARAERFETIAVAKQLELERLLVQLEHDPPEGLDPETLAAAKQFAFALSAGLDKVRTDSASARADAQLIREQLVNPDSPTAADVAYTPAPAPGQGGLAGTDLAERRWEQVVAIIVRAELAAWARTELPNLIRAEIERVRPDPEQK
jgi:transcriptional regulator with XRE-family HTH domain